MSKTPDSTYSSYLGAQFNSNNETNNTLLNVEKATDQVFKETAAKNSVEFSSLPPLAQVQGIRSPGASFFEDQETDKECIENINRCLKMNKLWMEEVVHYEPLKYYLNEIANPETYNHVLQHIKTHHKITYLRACLHPRLPEKCDAYYISSCIKLIKSGKFTTATELIKRILQPKPKNVLSNMLLQVQKARSKELANL